jgi:death-on-curing protein
MMSEVRYFSVDEVIALHELIMIETGWEPAPLRSHGLLESAVLRPQNLAHYQGADIVEQAASLGIGISQNQPFLDGNKRTAYVVMNTFLEANGFVINAAPLDIAHELVRVAERPGEFDDASSDFASWIRDRQKSLREPV